MVQVWCPLVSRQRNASPTKFAAIYGNLSNPACFASLSVKQWPAVILVKLDRYSLQYGSTDKRQVIWNLVRTRPLREADGPPVSMNSEGEDERRSTLVKGRGLFVRKIDYQRWQAGNTRVIRSRDVYTRSVHRKDGYLHVNAREDGGENPRFETWFRRHSKPTGSRLVNTCCDSLGIPAIVSPRVPVPA